MIDRLRRQMPTPQALAANRWLRWLGPALQHPRLWHMSRRGIALGVAIGVFFGMLVPIAQIPLSAAAAVLLRANVPSAVASTLVTNPVTFPPLYYAAWRVGSAVLGRRADAAPPAAVLAAGELPQASGGSWFERTWRGIGKVGRPLLLGLAIFACGFGFATWLLVNAAWHLRVRLKRRRRMRRRPA
jgi:uncharacterized protein (DUF2062 family)